MGLNDFVSLFYGSTQNLHTSGIDSVDATSSSYTADTLEMLRNHRNSKLQKFNLNNYADDVKLTRNLTLTSLKQQQKQKNYGSGVSAVNSDNSGGGKVNLSATAVVTASSSSGSGGNGSGSGTGGGVGESSIKASNAGLRYASSSSDTCTISATNISSGSEMDLLRAPGLRKKSSFLWNSFRIPRKQKGEIGNFLEGETGPFSRLISESKLRKFVSFVDWSTFILGSLRFNKNA
uniref:Uncharacterized protein n=1 Tax=Glossina austeni TaxID=7395 RepID=A0A1A9V818_GLOAU